MRLDEVFEELGVGLEDGAHPFLACPLKQPQVVGRLAGEDDVHLVEEVFDDPLGAWCRLGVVGRRPDGDIGVAGVALHLGMLTRAARKVHD